MLILRCRVTCFANSLFRRLSSPIFQVSLVFGPSTLDSSCRHVSVDRNVGGCFLDTLELGGVFPWSGRFMCVLTLLPVWYYGMELIPLSSILLLLSACNMTRGQEETSTSQAGRRRGPGRDTPSTSSIISSLSITGYFVGRGLLYLHLEVGTLRLTIPVGLEPPGAICYRTP